MRPRGRAEQIDLHFADQCAISHSLAHPLRVDVLNALGRGGATPAQVADEVGEGLANVVYHVARLRECGFIELVEARRTSRSVEHVYRVCETEPLMREIRASDGAASGIEAAVEEIAARLAEAVERGAFEQDLAFTVLRQPMLLDEESWRELGELIEQAASRIDALARRSAQRTERDPGIETTEVELALLRFVAPTGADAPA